MSLTAAVETIMRQAAERAILPHYQQLTSDQIVAKAADDAVTVARMRGVLRHSLPLYAREP